MELVQRDSQDQLDKVLLLRRHKSRWVLVAYLIQMTFVRPSWSWDLILNLNLHLSFLILSLSYCLNYLLLSRCCLRSIRLSLLRLRLA
jgi:hypothetical protein